MHVNLVVHLLVFSLFLINVVICIEPLTMSVGAAVVGKLMTSLRFFYYFYFFFRLHASKR